jgi:hypothetical protein
MQLRQRQKTINEDKGPHLAAPRPEVFDTAGKPLPTGLTAREPVHVVSQRPGHTSAVVTMTVYAHVLPGSQREAADLFARLVGEAGA